MGRPVVVGNAQLGFKLSPTQRAYVEQLAQEMGSLSAAIRRMIDDHRRSVQDGRDEAA